MSFSVRALALALACLAGACSPPEPVGGPAKVREVSGWEAVGSYRGLDTATGETVEALLRAQGIESLVFGSAGYTVSVPVAGAGKARELLRDAASRGLPVTVIAPS